MPSPNFKAMRASRPQQTGTRVGVLACTGEWLPPLRGWRDRTDAPAPTMLVVIDGPASSRAAADLGYQHATGAHAATGRVTLLSDDAQHHVETHVGAGGGLAVAATIGRLRVVACRDADAAELAAALSERAAASRAAAGTFVARVPAWAASQGLTDGRLPGDLHLFAVAATPGKAQAVPISADMVAHCCALSGKT